MYIWMNYGRLNKAELVKGDIHMKECTVIVNTRWGYCMEPKKCKSIAEAVKYAKEMEMAYRVFVGGECVKRGW